MTILSFYLINHTPNFRDRSRLPIINIWLSIPHQPRMTNRMKRVLSSLEKARLHLDNSAPRPDVHSVVHDLMQELIDAMGIDQSRETVTDLTDETWERAWLYDLIESLTDTCFTLSETPPDEVAITLRRRLDCAIEGGLRPRPMHA